MTGRKDDVGKLRWRLLPLWVLRPVVRVLMHGAERYGDQNYLHVEGERYHDALMRHWDAHWSGEIIDPDSGEPHLAHVAANAIILLHKQMVS